MSVKKPYNVPEGYFEQLQMRLSEIPQHSEVAAPTGMSRFTPYLALAACFMFIFVLGSIFVRRPAGTDSTIDYEQMRYADIIPYNYGYDDDEDSQDEVSDLDLIEYLIATNTSADLIAYETNE